MNSPATSGDIQAATAVIACVVTVGMAISAWVSKRREDERRAREADIAEALTKADTAKEVRSLGDKIDSFAKSLHDHIEDDRRNFAALRRDMKSITHRPPNPVSGE
jgi:Flp pilus assembly protein TadB